MEPSINGPGRPMRSFVSRLARPSTLAGGAGALFLTAVACYGTPRTHTADGGRGGTGGASGGSGSGGGASDGGTGGAGVSGMGVDGGIGRGGGSTAAGGGGGTAASGGMGGAGGTGEAGGDICSTNADCTADSFCGDGRCISDVVTVAAGYWHTCAARKDGKVFCWGGNDTAQVGAGASGNVLRPAEVLVGQPIRKLALGGGFSCAITTDNRVMCWGDDEVGQLGDGTPGGHRAAPAFVKMQDGRELNSVVDLAAGGCFSCALTTTSDVGIYCWGCNNRSQLGRTTTEAAQSAVPLLVPSSSTARQLAVGAEDAHFVGNDMVCGWGYNFASSLAASGTTSFAMPTCFSLTSVSQPLLGDGFGCGRLASGAVQCWGLQIGSSTILAPPGTPVPGIVATTLGGGMDHVCARDVNANVRCWGANGYGALGDGSNQDSTIPTTVLDPRGNALTGVLSDGLTSSGYAMHSCAILGDGSLHCWGWNMMGQIGNGVSNTSERRATPVKW